MSAHVRNAQEVLDRQTHQIGVGFLAAGLAALALFWRLQILAVEVFDCPLGAGAVTTALCGVVCLAAPRFNAWRRERRRALGIVGPSIGTLDRLARFMAPRRERRAAKRGDVWKQLGGTALLVGMIWLATDEISSRARSWKETTCRVQSTGGGRVRATYEDGIRTLSFSAGGIGASSGSVPCYVMPGSKYGSGTFQRPTGDRIPRSLAFDVVLVLTFAVGVALIAIGRAQAKGRAP